MARGFRKRNIDFRYNWKTYWSFMKKYKLSLLLLMGVVFIVEALNVVDKFLFKKIIDDGALLTQGIITREAYIAVLLIIASIYISFILFKTIGRWFHIYLINKIETRAMFDLKERYFNHILKLSYKFHTTHKTGSLISRLIKGSGAMERMTDFLVFNTLPLVFQIAIVAGSLLYFDISSAIVIIISTILFISYSLFVLQKQRPANLKSNRTEDIEKGIMADFFTNIDSIKHFGKEDYISYRFRKLATNSRKALFKHWSYHTWFDAGHAFILAVTTFLLVYFPLIKFLNNELTLGTLVFVYTVYGNLFGALFGFVHSVRGYYRSMADFQDLFEYGKIDNDIKDKHGARDLKIDDGRVEFKSISFRYHKRQLFSKFDLKIPAGKKVALVGHSGSGKSTLVKLLYRLYDVDKGEILIDNKNIKNFKQESLRSELSIVPQECVLFDDTIYNNIAFSRPSATRKEVLDAMKFAQLDKIVNTFPKKENTVVGERGVRLSGGEKQRVSIARAILANKKILILDEATSSLDSQTEHDIQNDLKRLMKGRTNIIIAHRLSTIMNSDIIVVLDKGKIVQMGTHQELISKKGRYKELWSLQKGGYLQD